MKLRRISLPIVLGLSAIGLAYAPTLMASFQPNDAKLIYSLSHDLFQALALVCLMLYFWTSGTLISEHKKISVALLLAALLPISGAFGFAIYGNYQAVHNPPDSDYEMIRDDFSPR